MNYFYVQFRYLVIYDASKWNAICHPKFHEGRNYKRVAVCPQLSSASLAAFAVTQTPPNTSLNNSATRSWIGNPRNFHRNKRNRKFDPQWAMGTAIVVKQALVQFGSPKGNEMDERFEWVDFSVEEFEEVFTEPQAASPKKKN